MSIRKFRKQMKPFIIVLTVVFILSLAYSGYESFRKSRADKKAQEAMLLNADYVQKIDIERAKQELNNTYKEGVDKSIIDILAFNDVIEKNLTLHLAKDLKIKVPSSEIDKQYQELEASMGDKEQFKRMLQVQGLTKDSLKKKIEENLLIQKTIEQFSKDINPTDEALNSYIALHSLVNADRAKVLESYKFEKGAEKYRIELGKAKKAMTIKELAPEYEALVEKTSYEEEGFAITNLDLAKATIQVMLSKKTTKEEAEKEAKQIISNQIKVAKIAKEKGVSVDENLDMLSQLQEYLLGLSKKVGEDVKPTDKELREFFERYKNRYDILPSADAKLTFINVKPSKEDENLSKQKAEKVLAEVTTQNFEKKGNELKATGEYVYEDLGTFQTGMMVKEFEEAVKDAPSNSIVKKVVKTGYGYHVIFVRENDSKNSKWTASHIMVPTKPSESTIKAKMDKLNKVKSDVEAGVIAFNDKIDEDVIQNIEVKDVSPDGNIPNVGYSPEIAKAIFEAPLNSIKIINNFGPTPTKYTILLVQKTKEVKPELANFEKSKEQVKIDYINLKVAEYMAKLFK